MKRAVAFGFLFILFLPLVLSAQFGSSNSNSNANINSGCIERDERCCLGNNCTPLMAVDCVDELIAEFKGCDENCKPRWECQERERERERERIRNFVPWQKRNETDCPSGCKCVGAVMMCRTEQGRIMNITAGNSGKIITLEKVRVNISLEIEVDEEQNVTRISAVLKNGSRKLIKVMPETASERAIERLGQLGFNVTLKEVGEGNENKIVYEAEAEKKYKIFGLIRARARVHAVIDAETGEIVSVKKPWWSFLASEVK